MDFFISDSLEGGELRPRQPLATLAGAWRLLRSFCPILRPLLLPTFNPCRIHHAADDVVTHARKVFNAPAANDNDRVLLQGVAFAGDISGYLHAVRKPHAANFAERGVRLLRSRGKYFKTHSSFKGRRRIHWPIFDGIKIVRQSRRFRFRLNDFSSFFN